MPPRPPAVVRPVGNVALAIPEVATTASDGFPVLHPGKRRWNVAVLLNQWAAGRSAWLEVNSTRCAAVELPPGSIVRLPCTYLVKPHSTVTVRLMTADGVVSTWKHTVR